MMMNKNKWTLPALLAAILLALPVSFTGCADLGYPELTTTPEATTQPDKPVTTPVSTRNDVQMAVYRHLLEMAESPKAKNYLADFYAAGDNWTATSEVFRDGSGTWHVQVDMTAAAKWPHENYWQQAGWYVFKDGRVIPSTRFEANALRIEADLQSLSLIAEDNEAAE